MVGARPRATAISALHQELLRLCIGHLEDSERFEERPNSIIAASAVCKQWRDAALDETLWRGMCLRRWPTCGAMRPTRWRALFEKRCAVQAHATCQPASPIGDLTDASLVLDLWVATSDATEAAGAPRAVPLVLPLTSAEWVAAADGSASLMEWTAPSLVAAANAVRSQRPAALASQESLPHADSRRVQLLMGGAHVWMACSEQLLALHPYCRASDGAAREPQLTREAYPISPWKIDHPWTWRMLPADGGSHGAHELYRLCATIPTSLDLASNYTNLLSLELEPLTGRLRCGVYEVKAWVHGPAYTSGGSWSEWQSMNRLTERGVRDLFAACIAWR
jgi:hypothetical protein